MTIHSKYKYQCVDCGAIYPAGEVTYLCPSCSAANTDDTPPKGVLKVLYNYDELIEKQKDFNSLRQNGFLDLLPLKNLDSLPNLRVGKTPLYLQKMLHKKSLPFQIFLKDDSQNPTYSFKDRASNLVSAYAKENGIETIVAASTGNAGSSLAGICAAQGQKAIILVPEAAPKAKLTQIVMYGATIVPVQGTYDDAFDLSIQATEEFGWYNRNTAFNPLTIEGKKTVSFELYEQLDYQIPDRIFVPVGDGVIISGVYKGFEDLLQLGIIKTMPCIVAVQSEGSNNLIANIQSDIFTVKPSQTIADSISVDIPRNFYMAVDFLKKYKGETLQVSDAAIIEASTVLSKHTGLFAEPAAATAYAGILHYFKNNKIQPDSKNVVLLTGSGLKDLNAVQSKIQIPKAITPTLDHLKNMVL